MSETLTTPADRFESLPGYTYEPRYLEIDEASMAYVDVGEGEPILCLHGMATWSYLYRQTIPVLEDEFRVVAPDLIGFGQSDKYLDADHYSFSAHVQSIVQLVERLDVEEVTLVCQDWGGIVGLAAVPEISSRIRRLVAVNVPIIVKRNGTLAMTDAFYETQAFLKRQSEIPIGFLVDRGCVNQVPGDVQDAYEAPFPDERSKAAIRAFPDVFPTESKDDGTELLADAREHLSTWDDPAFALFGETDPISKPAAHWFRGLVPGSANQPDVWLEGGHFLAEDAGEEVGRQVLEFVDRTS